MEENIKQHIELNHQQLQMLELFKKPMSTEDFTEVRRCIVKILARNIDEEMEKLEKDKGWTSETYEKWGNEHNRVSSTKKVK